MNNQEVMLTTIDNPFNPFEQLEAWRMYDIEKQHFTCERLARMTRISPEMSQSEIDQEIDRAMDEIIKYDPEDIFIKITNPITHSTYLNQNT